MERVYAAVLVVLVAACQNGGGNPPCAGEKCDEATDGAGLSSGDAPSAEDSGDVVDSGDAAGAGEVGSEIWGGGVDSGDAPSAEDSGDVVDSGDAPSAADVGSGIWGDAIVTVYSFQDNSACNSTMTASGAPLVPYVSVALPFRYLKGLGEGPFELGDSIHVSFLQGRAMPDGSTHNGWVRIDDYCGDGGDDSYCLQNGLPNVDVYVGDWATSAMACVAEDPEAFGTGSLTGPGGTGQEMTQVAFGPAPDGALAMGYGGAAMGEGNCGDCEFARTVQPPACWHYDPGSENIEYCDCSNSNGVEGECD